MLPIFRIIQKICSYAQTLLSISQHCFMLLKNNMKSCSNILLKVQFQTTSFIITYTTCKHKIFIGIRSKKYEQTNSCIVLRASTSCIMPYFQFYFHHFLLAGRLRLSPLIRRFFGSVDICRGLFVSQITTDHFLFHTPIPPIRYSHCTQVAVPKNSIGKCFLRFNVLFP